MALESFAYIMPLFAFLLVFLVTYALLAKTKILGGSNFFHLFLSFIIAIIFVVAPSAQNFALVSTPWIAVFLISLFFIVMILSFVQGNIDDLVKSPFVAIVLVGIVLIIFIISAINVFGPLIAPYLPGHSEASLTSQQAYTKHFFLSPAVIGGVILLIIAALASWILAK